MLNYHCKTYPISVLIIFVLSFDKVLSQDKCAIGCKCFRSVANCSNQHVGAIPPSGSFDFNVIYLDMSYNVLDELKDDLITYPYLRNVTFKNNSIGELDPWAFQGLTNLLQLDLSENNIRTFHKGTFNLIPQLQHLSLCKNTIDTIEEHLFGGLRELEYLDISFNLVSNIMDATFHSNGQLKFLYLGHNYISSISELTFKEQNNLQQLDLSYNKIQTLLSNDFTALANLEWLSLSHNSVTQIASDVFRNLRNITYLDLSSNKISGVHEDLFSNCSQLQNLSLANNKISHLEPKVVKNIDKLKYLDMRNNNFNSFDYTMFIPLRSLELLDFGLNNMKTLDQHVVKWMMEADTVIGLAGNPWNCTCDSLYEVYKILHQESIKNISLLCETPEDLRQRSWDILQHRCSPSTTESVTVTESINDNTSSVTEANEVLVETSFYSENFLDKNIQMTSSKSKPFPLTIIFVGVFAVAILIIVVILAVITRHVRKPNLNERWWEDEVTRKDLMSEQ